MEIPNVIKSYVLLCGWLLMLAGDKTLQMDVTIEYGVRYWRNAFDAKYGYKHDIFLIVHHLIYAWRSSPHVRPYIILFSEFRFGIWGPYLAPIRQMSILSWSMWKTRTENIATLWLASFSHWVHYLAICVISSQLMFAFYSPVSTPFLSLEDVLQWTEMHSTSRFFYLSIGHL